jgi:hypothetical protein
MLSERETANHLIFLQSANAEPTANPAREGLKMSQDRLKESQDEPFDFSKLLDLSRFLLVTQFVLADFARPFLHVVEVAEN